MATEKFILVSLEDKKAKELANVISNDTSRTILDFLSEQDAAENDIAKKLDIPASTVHYNVQLLLKHDLIEVKDFYWSDKGNKVNVYTVAKKIIVIAPKSMRIKTKLKSILPVALLALAASGAIHVYQNYFMKPGGLAGPEKMMAAQEIAVGGGRDMVESASQEAFAAAPEAVQQVVQAQPNYAMWFLFGAFFVIAVYIFITEVFKKKE
ncbi:MAG: helix-turn-helix domain-containing protein [Nanoarchaeota archaeon]|nr:helix-turn-helix domain-containing protein [Nanoarchaeota archaeon]